MERKNLIATPTGVELISLIHEELLKSAELTGIWERRLRLIEKKTYDAKTFLEELKQMVAEIVHTVLADNTNRRVAETQEDKPAPKEKKGAAKEKPTKTQKTTRKIASKREQTQARLTMPSGNDLSKKSTAPQAAIIPATPPAPKEGDLCPLCGKGHIIKGKTAFGCSEWKNGCTFRALSEVEKTLQQEGIETEIFHIGTEAIRGCMGCGMCRKNKLGRCIFGEDAVNVVIKKMEECDGLIVGSPVHYAGASGGITSFLDRMFYSTGGFSYKPGAAIVSCRRAGSTAALEQMNKYFMMNNMPLVPSAYWNMVHGNTPEEVEQDLEGLMVMRTLGRNMAWMLKSIDAGKAHGILTPAAEPKTRTNFIRECAPVKAEAEEKNFAPYFISYNKVNKAYQEED